HGAHCVNDGHVVSAESPCALQCCGKRVRCQNPATHIRQGVFATASAPVATQRRLRRTAMAEIIRAHDDDWSLVREIRLRSLSTDPSAFGQSWETESTYEDKVWKKRVREAAWFLAVDDGQPVAVVAVRHEGDSPANERELQAMWVLPSARKSGIA